MAIATPPNPLGERLRAARGKMLNKDLAAAAGWGAPKVSKIEGGRQLPTEDDLRIWAGITGAGGGVLDQWISMLEQVQADRHRFVVDMAAGQQLVQQQYETMIAATTDFRFYEKVFVPRFLQTPAYTRGILTWGHTLYRPEIDLNSAAAQQDIDASVALRQSSTSYLFDPGRKFQFILDEAVLRTWRIDAETMRGQLFKIQGAIGLPNVRIGIFPQNSMVGVFNPNSFEIYGDLVTVETTLGDTPHVRGDEVDAYRAQMDRLWADVIEGDEAYQLIEDARTAIPH
jgi:transcriptional regulator with XRE-family HTH domain